MNIPSPIKTLLFVILLFGVSSLYQSTFAQVFQTVQSGPWNDGATWGNASPGTPGTDYPSVGNDAIITGGVTITASGQFTCRNLLIDINTSNTITVGPLPFMSVTVQGTMAGWDMAGFPNLPVSGSVINGTGGLIFTGSDINGLGAFLISNEVIAYWNNSNSINSNVIFNKTTAPPISIDWLYTPAFAPTSIDFSNNVTISAGTLINGANAITGFNVAGTSLTVSSGATLDLTVPITSDGTNSINQISISGTVTTTSYINANTFTINSGGILNTAYNGAEGWWTGTNRPTTFIINDASRINYNAGSNQTIYPRQYGNLWLSNSGTKALYYNASTANDPLEINGNFNISSGPVTFNCDANPNPISIKGNLSNVGTWTPNKTIVFDGTGTQAITGTGTTFTAGITIGDGATTNSVTLSNALVTTNLLINSNATFNPQNNDITVSGNWSNSGTFVPGTSLVTFNGTTNLTGSTSFNDVTITGTINVNAVNNTFNDVIVSGSGVVNSNNSYSVNSLVNNGTVNGLTASISLAGSFTNNGTFNRGTGTLVFNGSGTQNFDGSSTTGIHNITISNTNPGSDVVNINSNVNLYNILTLDPSSRIDADGSSNNGVLTFISENNATAKVGPIGDLAVFDGNITVQRRIYPDIGAQGWRYICPPVKNQTLADWSDDIFMQGVTGGPAPGATDIVYYYDETLGTDPFGVNGWVPLADIGDNITNAPVKVFLFDSQINGLVMDNTGPPIVGNGLNSTVNGTEKFTIPLDFTPTTLDGGGWNLVYNPYPCEIDFEHVISTTGGKDAGLVNVNGGIYLWDPTAGASGNYVSYISGVGTGAATQYIASGQAFFVKANNTGASISFIEDDKVTNRGNTFIREGAVENVLIANIKSSDEVNFDQTAIRFKEGSSDAFEGEFDAYKLPFGMINISTIPTSDLDLSINTLGDVTGAKSIKFRIAAYAYGSYTISFEGFESFTRALNYRLVDNYAGTSVMVNPDTEYTFTIDEAIAETQGDDRFELQVMTPVTLNLGEVAGVVSGQEFVLPVTGDQLMDIYGTKITVEWDNTVLEYVGVEELSYMVESDFDLSSTADGVLVLDYSSVSPISLEDGSQLFAIRFNALPGTPETEVAFGEVEILGADDVVISYEVNNTFITISQLLNVLGTVATENGEVINGLNVHMFNTDESFDTMTDENGNYSFDAFQGDEFTLNVTEGEGFRVREGLSVFDMILTRLHILGVREFDSPYKVLAADVNNSSSVTSLDVFEIGLVLLGWHKEFTSGLNWLYIPSELDISADPFSYETNWDITVGDMDETVDFVGVKLGDVNNSWVSSYAQRKSNEDFPINLEIVSLMGEYVEIPVTVSKLSDIMGYQFTLTWDPNELEFAEIISDRTDGMFNEQFVANGILTTAWNEEGGQAMQLDNGSTLFTLRLRTISKNANSIVDVNSSLTEALAVDANLNIMDIKATPGIVDLNRLRDGSLALFQNVPNPFDNNTQIDFRIAKEGTARITVINALGELVYMHENNYTPGIYSISWDRSQGMRSITPGMYLYRLESNGEEVVKKMMIE